MAACWLDPSRDEALREDGSLLLALMPSRNLVRSVEFTCIAALGRGPHQREVQVTEIALRGVWAKSELTDVMQLALGGCMQVDRAIRDCLMAAATPD